MDEAGRRSEPNRSNSMRRVALALLAASIAQPALAAAFSFTPIGNFSEPGFSQTEAVGISGDGRWVTGNALRVNSGGSRIIRWSEETGLEDLAPGAGSAISNDGSVVVGRGGPHLENSSTAIRWTAATGSVDLGTLEPQGPTEAFDVSADGSVVVGTSVGGLPFKWTQASGMIALPGSGFASRPSGDAHAVSADGSVIVGHDWDYALLWSGDGEPLDLGFVPESHFGDAWGVSADGTTVVGRSGDQAFRWTQQTGMIGLGHLFSDQYWGYGLGVSADGAIVVGYAGSGVEQVATIWDPIHGLRPLQDLLESKLDLTGWHLFSANAISDDGRTIVGAGVDPDGFLQGWVAVIPEPSSALLIVLGLACMSLRRA